MHLNWNSENLRWRFAGLHTEEVPAQGNRLRIVVNTS